MLSLKRGALIALLISALSSCGGEEVARIEDQEKWFYENKEKLVEIAKNINESNLGYISIYDEDISEYSSDDRKLFARIKFLISNYGLKSTRIIRTYNEKADVYVVNGISFTTKVLDENEIFNILYIIPEYREEKKTLIEAINCKELNVPNWYSCVYNRD